jgi:hypothetical protein
MKASANNLSRHLIPAIVLFVLGLWSVRALFHPGLYTAHDIWHNVARLYWYAQALSQGEWLPAWISPLAGGYGYPLFIFSYPLPWLLGYPLVAVGISIEIALKILYGSSFVASGLLMYGFGFRMFRSRLAALATGVLYMIAPYHFLTTFVSAATGIAVSYALIPLLFWGIWEIGQEKYQRGSILLALGLAGVITSHLILAVMLSLFALMWSLFILLKTKRKLLALKHIGFGGMIGLGVAAFYLIPFAAYANLIRAQDPGAGFANLYATNFASIKQLLYAPWGFGPIISNAKDGEISLQVGVAQWLAFFLVTLLFGAQILLIGVQRQFSVVYELLNKKEQARRKKYATGRVLYLLYALSVFAIWELSKPLWDMAAQVMPLDYPFRLLVVTVLFGSLLAGWVIRSARWQMLRLVLTGVFIAVAVYTNRNHLRVNLYTSIPISDYVQAEKTTNTMDEYLPLVADRRLLNEPYRFVEPSQKISQATQTLNETKLTIEASQSATVTLGQWQFPGQTVFLNNKELMTKTAADGRIEIELPEGVHEVIISYQKGFPFKVGLVVTGISVLLLLGAPIMQLYRKKQS